MAAGGGVQVAVVDSWQMGRDLLCGSLSSHRGIEVCAACQPGKNAFQLIRAQKPHVVIFRFRQSDPVIFRFVQRFSRCFPSVGRIAILDEEAHAIRFREGMQIVQGPQRVCTMKDSLVRLVTCIQELSSPAAPSSGDLFWQ